MQIAYLKHMRHFMGWPGAKAALGMSGLSACTATRAVWTTLQVELAFVLPLCAVSDTSLHTGHTISASVTALQFAK